jgi:hypothetical protein
MTTGRASIIADRLGAEHAARLSAIVGGTRLHVPGNLDNAGRLRRLLGDELATLVVLHFGDSRFYVPRAAPSAEVDLDLVEGLAALHWSSARIARKLGCSERVVDRKRAILRSRARSNHPRNGDDGSSK